MKIKAIRPTNKFAEIKFEEVIKDPVGKRVYTPSGFQPVLACGFIKRGPTLKLKLDDGHELMCDPKHRVQAALGANLPVWSTVADKYVEELNQDEDCVIGYDGVVRKFTVEPGPVEDLYDIQLPAPHHWYTSGVVSHNSIMLCNNAIASLKGESSSGQIGQDVLLVTFELDTIKTAMRCVASMFGVQLPHIPDRQDYIRRVAKQFQGTYKKKFLIHELPPDECSVAHIYALIANLKRTVGWKPDVVILDYMDLMVSRNPAYNKDDYTRQKHVANEIRGLAKNENVLVFTATQTNRDGSKGAEVVDLTKASESFAKQFSMDYVVSLNQSPNDRLQLPPRIRLYVAKNRNGPKHDMISCEINYDIMQVKELL